MFLKVITKKKMFLLFFTLLLLRLFVVFIPMFAFLFYGIARGIINIQVDAINNQSKQS